MSDVQTTNAETEVGPLEPLRWRSWPLVEHPWSSAGVGAGLIGVGILVGLFGPWPWLAVPAVLMLIVALWRFFLPVTFELNEYGVEQTLLGRAVRIPWQSIREYRPRQSGVLLVPRGEHSAMAAFSGTFLPFGTHREQVLRYAEHFLRPIIPSDLAAKSTRGKGPGRRQPDAKSPLG